MMMDDGWIDGEKEGGRDNDIDMQSSDDEGNSSVSMSHSIRTLSTEEKYRINKK